MRKLIEKVNFTFLKLVVDFAAKIYDLISQENVIYNQGSCLNLTDIHMHISIKIEDKSTLESAQTTAYIIYRRLKQTQFHQPKNFPQRNMLLF